MIVTGTVTAAEATRTTFPLLGGFAAKKTLIVSREAGRPSPHVFLIEQSPGSVVRPHFHHNSEFQVVVAGGGLFGKHDFLPLTVHYAGQQTGYGPITAGPGGLTYFTLRPVTEIGAWFLPDARDRIDRRIPKGQKTSPRVTPIAPAELRTLANATVDTVITPSASGLAAWLVRLPPGQRIAAPTHVNGLGRFYLVTSGSLRSGGEDMIQHTSIWVSPDDAFPLESGPAGVEVLVMQFPANAWAYESALGRAPDGDPKG